MDRRTMLKELSASDLRSELITRIRDEIRRHEQEIEKLNSQIRQLQPTETIIVRRAIRNARGVARNERPLRQVIAEVLRDSPEPMSINDIMEAVKKTGYQSNATNFRGVISMSLSNNQMFEKAGRGMYVLSAGAMLEDDDDASVDADESGEPADRSDDEADNDPEVVVAGAGEHAREL